MKFGHRKGKTFFFLRDRPTLFSLQTGQNVHFFNQFMTISLITAIEGLQSCNQIIYWDILPHIPTESASLVMGGMQKILQSRKFRQRAGCKMPHGNRLFEGQTWYSKTEKDPSLSPGLATQENKWARTNLISLWAW